MFPHKVLKFNHFYYLFTHAGLYIDQIPKSYHTVGDKQVITRMSVHVVDSSPEREMKMEIQLNSVPEKKHVTSRKERHEGKEEKPKKEGKKKEQNSTLSRFMVKILEENKVLKERVVVISPSTGKLSKRREENIKAMTTDLVVPLIDEKNALVVRSYDMDLLCYNKYGQRRKEKLDYVIFDCLDRKGAYLKPCKQIKTILEYTKHVFIFAPRTIAKKLKFLPTGVSVTHFCLVYNQQLKEVKDVTVETPKKRRRKRTGDKTHTHIRPNHIKKPDF